MGLPANKNLRFGNMNANEYLGKIEITAFRMKINQYINRF